MIIEIPDDNSIVKWRYKDNEDWKSAEISDLIKAYERPQGKWEWVQYDANPNIGNWHCSECGIIIVMCKNSYNNFCPNCGVKMGV